MARSIEEIKRSDLFIKSSTDDFQDPVFLTFTINFFPAEEQYPEGDGLSNSALLKPLTLTVDNTGLLPISQNAIVEYPAIQWLNEYYHNTVAPPNLGNLTPAAALGRFHTLLAEVQDSPWYFQSIQGIGELWQAMHRVKEGTQKTTLTVNCIDSVKQPLTELAEMYRYAVYDNERMAYRLPENLRWFDMIITLIEIRDIADYSGKFFTTDSDGNLTSGLRAVQFKCKMCEFDFSNFMGGPQSDHKVYTEEKPFMPSFGIKVGWVIQQPVAVRDAYDYKQLGMFAGALGSLNNRLSRFIQNATRLPAAIVGSVLNEIQTLAEVKVMGNVYSGVNAFLTDMNNVSGNLTGRAPLVGPPIVSNIGEDIYPTVVTDQVQSIGGVYQNEPPAQQVNGMGDTYEDAEQPTISSIGEIYQPVEPTQIDDIGMVYPVEPPAPAISEMDDVYPDEPGSAIQEIGDVYPDEPAVPAIEEIGDVYPDEPGTQVADIGDVYPDEPAASAVSDMGDVYPDEPGVQVDSMGDVYPDQPAALAISDMGDTYLDEAAAEAVADMGDAYPVDEQSQGIGEIGSAYSATEELPEVGTMSDAYPDGESSIQVGDLGDVYQKEELDQVADIGDVYQQAEETEPAEDLGSAYQPASQAEPVGELGDVYQEIQTEEVSQIGDAYLESEELPETSDMGGVYQMTEVVEPVRELGDVYEDVPPVQVDSMGDVYRDEEETQKIDDLGETYKPSN